MILHYFIILYYIVLYCILLSHMISLPHLGIPFQRLLAIGSVDRRRGARRRALRRDARLRPRSRHSTLQGLIRLKAASISFNFTLFILRLATYIYNSYIHIVYNISDLHT